MTTKTPEITTTVIDETCKETAVRVRAELKKLYPGVKFSVRTQYAANMSAINIGWTDGPIEKEVYNAMQKYAYGTFDGMTDCAGIKEPTLSIDGTEAVLYRPGAKFVGATRKISAEFKAELEAEVKEALGIEEIDDRKIYEAAIWGEYARELEDGEIPHMVRCTGGQGLYGSQLVHQLAYYRAR